jgi:fused
VIGVLIHPIFGDIFTFPWKRNQSEIVFEFSENLPYFENIKQLVVNALLEIDWLGIFIKLYNSEEEATSLTKISIMRVILQCIRISKEMVEKCSGNKNLIYLIQFAIFNEDAMIAGPAMQILIYLMKQASNKRLDIYRNIFLVNFKKNADFFFPIIELLEKLSKSP